MEEPRVIEILKNELGFSDSSIKKLKKFHNYLLEYNKRYNLISKNTENSIWNRHILDSAQIIKFKLNKIRPNTLGQALRIDGVTPAAAIIILSHIKRSKTKATA